MIPYDASAAPSERGGALYVPIGGGNRIDNPDLYDVLYLAATAEAAIAETFGRIPIWTPETFVHGSGRAYALATYSAGNAIAVFDLDDVDALKSIGVTKPSAIVTRDRTKTQAWARAIFQVGRYAGAKWWSYYGPDWTVMGLWDRASITVDGTPSVISTSTPAVIEAAATIVRQIVP